MRLNSPPTRRVFSRLAAVAIVLWWGGLNCLAGCLTVPSGAAAGVHCSMDSGGDCCQSQADGEEAPAPGSIGEPSTSLQPLACCALEAHSAEASRTVRVADGATTAAVLSRVAFAPEGQPRAQFPDRWARLPDRGGTHLLCCVSLI
jgi:hypothetical protein